MSEYLKQATDFLTATNTELSVAFVKHDKYFEGDKEARDIYNITLTRGGRKFTFTFGQSLNNSCEWMLNAGNKPKFAKKEQALKYAMDKAYPIRYVVKNPNFAAPNAYDVLACVEKYEVGTFEDFCSNYGYDTDSRKAEKTYHAVLANYNGLLTLFNEAEMEQLQEIN